MIKALLFALVVIMLMSDTLGLNLSLAPGLSVKNGFLYLIFTFIAIEAALTRNRKVEAMSIFVPYTLAVFVGLISWLTIVVVIKPSGYDAFESAILLKGGLADHVLVFFAFFYGITNEKDSFWLLKAMLWVFIVANLLSVIDFVNLPNLGIFEEFQHGRLGGPFAEPNQYASFLALLLPMLAILVTMERKPASRMLILGGFAISCVALLMTASRGGMLGLLCGGTMGTIYLRRYVAVQNIVSYAFAAMILILVAVIVAYAGGVGEQTFGRLVGQTTSGNAFDASSGRTLLWADAFGAMLKQPQSFIVGMGWNAYNEFGNFLLAPHNSYLRLFYELGVFGVTLILVALANILRTAKKSLNTADPKYRGLIIAFVYGIFSFLVTIFFVDIYSPWLFTWALVGTILRLASIEFKSSEDTDGETAPTRIAELKTYRLGKS